MSIKRVQSIDMLRGVAALSVCIFHFTNGNKDFLSENSIFKMVGSVGWSGVEMFFIISGFIIPYSLHKINYEYNGYLNFLFKRIIRIHPPFLISVFLILILNYLSTLSPYYKGSSFNFNADILTFHFLYLNDFLGQPWLNPVYWTLAVEFQYYIIIGLLFPLLTYQNIYINLFVLLLFLLSKLLFHQSFFLFHYSPFFTLGIFIFMTETTISFKKLYWIGLPLILAFICYEFGAIAFCISLFTSFLMLYVKNWGNKILLFLGTISYSLYLIHVPIGGRIINLSKNFFEDDSTRTIVILFALTITIICSNLFYRLIELPFIKLTNVFSNRVKAQHD